MTDEDGSTDEGPDSTGRIVVTNGIDLDKRYFYETIKAIAWSREIRLLSLFGPLLVLVIMLLMGVYFYLAIPTLPFGISASNRFLETVVQFVGSSDLGAILTVFGGYALLLVVWPHLREVGADLLNRWRELVQYFRSLGQLRHRSVWQNFNYWHTFTTHLSGRDPLIVLSESNDTPVSGVYGDSPHYGNIFVDAIYVRVRGDCISCGLRVCRWIQDAAKRKLRIALFVLPVVLMILRAVEMPMGILDFLRSDRVFAMSLAGTLLLLVAATPFRQFRVWYFVKSVRKSGYGKLLDDPDIIEPTGPDNRIRLSNSMFGYGLFYVSEFFYHLFGDRQYGVEIDVDKLLEGETSDTFPTAAYEAPSAAEAVAAAREIVWSALPAASVKAAAKGNTDPGLSVEIVGVDYYTVTSEGDESFQSEHVGERSGFRLSVKKFMSIPHKTKKEQIQSPPSTTPNLYRHDSWSNETTHHLLLGGGEHQQGINKLLLAMKAQGYEGIDILENAFAGRVRETTPDEGPYPFALLPTEYFVAFAGGDVEFFREDDAFLLLPHRVDEDEVVHVLIGMSAAGTKLGFLYWLDQYENDEFEELCLDKLHFFAHPSVHDVDGLDDIGDLYIDTSWHGSDALNFSRSEHDSYNGSVSPPDLDIGYYDLQVTYEQPDT